MANENNPPVEMSVHDALKHRGNLLHTALQMFHSDLLKLTKNVGDLLVISEEATRQMVAVPDGATPQSEMMELLRKARPELASLTDQQIIEMLSKGLPK